MKWRLLLAAFALVGLSPSTPVPAFEMWVACVGRGPVPGRADARVMYRYEGAVAIMAEESVYYGDIGTQNVMLATFAVEPGEHEFDVIPVGAFKR